MASHRTNRVRVELGARSYDILIGPGLLAKAGELMQVLKLGRRGVIITDSNVEQPYVEPLQAALRQAGLEADVLQVPAGEASKSLRQANRLFEKLPTLRLDRQSFILALGGGVVGDLAGFVAATYLRGIALVQVPTSLLAQVDSSIGGKTGVNLPQGKNLVGVFYQPRLVLADTETLRTLPERELRAGFAEVVKHGAIRDGEFFHWLEKNHGRALGLEPDAIAHVVRRCCEIKAEIVSRDEREAGVRALLNFGHTIGHAMEALTDYVGLLHGEAISMGMVCAAYLSTKHTELPGTEAARLRILLESVGLPVRLGDNYDLEELMEAMRLDKKALAGKLRFVLLKQIGDAIVSDSVTDDDVKEAIDVCR